jgi:MYXO-CTERM domain-containing protein
MTVPAKARSVAGAPPATRAAVAAGADLKDVPVYSAYLAAPPVAAIASAPSARLGGSSPALAAVQSRTTRKAPGVVAAVDARRPVPSFLFAPRGKGAARRSFARADQAALAYLDQYRSVYQLDGAAVATAEVAGVHASNSGSKVVWMRQRVDGREVHGTRMSFLVDPAMSLVAISGQLHPSVKASWIATIDGPAALARAVADVTGAAVPAAALAQVAPAAGGKARFASAAGASFHLPQPAMVREVFYALPRSLVPAFSVSVEVAASGSTSSRAYQYVIAADDGRILERSNRTFSEARSYRVWADGAEAGYRPSDGPHGDFTPHPTGDVNTPIEVVGSDTRIAAEVEGLNVNPDGAADPWLPEGATDLSTGNNVAAYADHAEPDGLSEGDTLATQNGSGAFAYGYNFGGSPIVGGAQIRTSIAQLFFTTNWLHDWWYGSGFTEETGNAQLANYGRGGEEGDVMLAEAQDTRGVERNNANMSTPPDGLSPRMQMYVFDGPITPIGETSFEITSPPDLAGEYLVQGSFFGVDDLVTASGNLVLVDDGVSDPKTGGTPTDGCEPFDGVAGAIAVITRGACTFDLKAQNAEAAGAAAALIVNNDLEGPDALPPLGGEDLTIAIPVVGISFADGQAIVAGLAGGPVAADVSRAGRDRATDRDGTIDNAIVAHEWGHYLHNRLTLCLSAQCGAMGEGWGDFVALHMMIRELDDLHGVYGAAAWATDSAYFGIRRVPYSVEMDRNALTFGHVVEGAALPFDLHPMQDFGSNSEVHNAGEIWATMLLEAYVALVEDKPGLEFADAQRRMGDYIVAGMLLAPPDPTFTEQRDAILAAIAATGDERDLQTVAEAFARRGAGTGAVSPGVDSFDFVGVEESFVTAGELVITGTEVVVDEDCDADGNLDAGERGHLLVTVANGGPVALSGTTVSAAEAPADVSFPEGESATIADLGPYQLAEVQIPLALDAGVEGFQGITVTVRAANSESFHETVDAPILQRINFDDSATSAKIDDVESKVTVWESTSDLGEEVGWLRADDGQNAVWHADDVAVPGEQSLTSPALDVGDGAFVLRFEHRHSFEASDDGTGTIAFWDGGVIEISTDGGETWQDVSELADPGYGGELFAEALNPLGGRQAYVAQNEGFPAMSAVAIDFGTALAGQQVMVRFRLGTDLSTGAPGWEVDNVAFEGIENSPFTSLVDDAAACGDEGDDGDGDGSDGDDDDGCGCRSGGSSAPLGVLLYAAVLLPFLRRRRRRA